MTERPHGYRRYKTDRCRCFTCRLDYSRHQRDIKAGKGPWAVDFMPIEPVVEHLGHLSASGVGYRRVAELTGVPAMTLRRWLYQREAVMCRKALAERVLAVDEATPARRWLDKTGTERRIKALGANGWPLADIARRIGWRRHNLVQIFERSEVFPRTFTRVAEVYDELWDQQPEPSRWVTRAKAIASRDGWFPPLAWDDETIDDRDALPCLLPPVVAVERDLELAVQHRVAGHAVPITSAVRRELVSRTLDWPSRDVAQLAACNQNTVNLLRRQCQAVAA